MKPRKRYLNGDGNIFDEPKTTRCRIMKSGARDVPTTRTVSAVGESSCNQSYSPETGSTSVTDKMLNEEHYSSETTSASSDDDVFSADGDDRGYDSEDDPGNDPDDPRDDSGDEQDSPSCDSDTASDHGDLPSEDLLAITVDFAIKYGLPIPPRSLFLRMFWKAKEWQQWLLFFALPCLDGILSPVLLEHFALLVKGVFLLLQNTVG